MDTKIKQDEIKIGVNIRQIRKEQNIGQTKLVRILNSNGIDTLVKIQRGVQHIKATQFKAIRDALNVSYNELLK